MCFNKTLHTNIHTINIKHKYDYSITNKYILIIRD